MKQQLPPLAQPVSPPALLAPSGDAGTDVFIAVLVAAALDILEREALELAHEPELQESHSL